MSDLGDAVEWLTVADACRLLGITPATLRRWSNEGRIAARTTPGGHRRFARSAVEVLLPPPALPHPHALAGMATPDGIARAYRREIDAGGHRPGFLDAVPSGAMGPLREYGRVITNSILAYLQAASDTARDAALAEGLIAAAGYGRIAASAGASMRETVAMFLHFRTPFVREMGVAARRRGLDALGATELLETVTVAIDRLLDATLEGYEHGIRRSARG